MNIDDPKLTAYALGELGDAEKREIEAQLEGDEAARREVEQIRALAGTLTTQLAAEAMPAVDPMPLKLHSRPRWAGRLVALAACLAIGGTSAAILWRVKPNPPAVVAKRTVPELQTEARKLVNETRYGEALAVLDQMLAQDPGNQYAASIRPLVSDRNEVTKQRQVRSEFEKQFAQRINEVGERKIPYDDILRYPTNWPDISELRDQKVVVGNKSQPDKWNQFFGANPQPLSASAPAADPKPGAAIVSGPALTLQPSPSVAPPVMLATPVASAEPTAALNASVAATPRVVSSGSGALVLSGTNQYAGKELPALRTDQYVSAKRLTEDGDVLPEAVRAERGNFNTESYDRIVDNPFLNVLQNPLSTFSIDVDTASYSNMRRFLARGQRPPKDSVRIEELVNYFPYDYAPPKDDKPFASHVEVAECPWETSRRLVRVALKGKEIARDKRPASNLVFLIDVSGSMQPENKLPLVKKGLRMLLDQLGGEDRVAMVVYAGSSGLVLPSTSCSEKASIMNALDQLEAGGSTNGAQGIQLAYSTAQSAFIEGGTNRVILCTDGDFNVGMTNQGDLTRLIEEKAKGGVFLSVLGFGMGNLKDSTMEKLADKGNGNYAYIDTQQEAKKVLVEQMSGTLVTIAKDVKIQIEFNPAVASSYRLIGYENRLLAKEDFNDDTKDAGEIGAGHTVTALYEVVPVGVKVQATTRPLSFRESEDLMQSNATIAACEKAIEQTSDPERKADLQRRLEIERSARRKLVDGQPQPAATLLSVDPLRYQKPAVPSGDSREMLTLKLRYKEPDGDTSKLLEFPVKDEGKKFTAASADFKFAASVAGFGMILRDSPHKGIATYSAVREWAEDGLVKDENGYRAEFIELVKKAQAIVSR